MITGRHDMRRGKAIQFYGALHLRLLHEAGAVPVPVPAVEGMQPHLDHLLESIHGLVVTEGGDIGPALQPGSALSAADLDDVDPVKDEIEAHLLRGALERDIPILGVCRGCELINVLLGGDLYGDLTTDLNGAVDHLDNDNYHAHRHPITLTPDSPLEGIYGARELTVTSYHHQGIRRLGDGLDPMATSPDGLVEAFRSREHTFVWGLQYHPERQLPDHPSHREIHYHLVDAARRVAAGAQ